MDKKRQTFGEAMREQILAAHDREAERAQQHPMTGDQLRTGIDKWNVPYTRVAPWLGLSIDGLHKQMRGVRAVTLQTRLLFNRLNAGFELQAREMWTNEERQHPDSPAFRSKMRRKAVAEARKLGL
jgi:hypothetical protein